MAMYSLYQAWLQFGSPSLNFQNNVPLTNPLNLTLSTNCVQPPPPPQPGSPDVSIQVGPSMTHFSAHKAILAAHSGYFKAAFINYTGMEPISVPNVNVDEFSYLLTFMYTGYLDLNIRNIYNILLATHILHMPAALDICRSFLLQTQNLETRTNVIKPIPSKKALVLTQPLVYSAPNKCTNTLPKSEDTPFKKVKNATPQIAEPGVKASTSKIQIKEDEMKKRLKKRNNSTPPGTSEQNTKVVVDVACCDGPVRFHKVVNKNYGIQESGNNATDENSSSSNNGETFTCLYCNHTFKSQYCYQKHARRHLNPVSVDVGTVKNAEPAAKREVKLLDMNVQYYPCKTCGSKFPSYYFVHKHRKLCHAEEMLLESNNEEEKSEGDNLSNSAIDVETVNSDNNNSSVGNL